MRNCFIVSILFLLLQIQGINFAQQIERTEDWLWKNEPFKNFDPNDEIIERRTLDSKHFRTGNKESVAMVAAGPLNYFENNRWNTIYHTILPSEGGFQNLTNSFKSYYPASSSGSLKTRLQVGNELKEMQQMKMYYLDASGNKLSEKSIANKTGSVDFNELTFKQVYGNYIDLRLTQLSTMRKLDYVVNNVQAFSSVSSTAKKIVFEEVIDLPSGWTASLSGNIIYLKNASGEVKATYEKPVIRETIPPHHDHSKGDHNHNHEVEGQYELIQLGNGKIKVKTIVDMAWMLDSHRNFPLYIDPTLNCTPDNTAQWTGHLVLNGSNMTNYTTTTIGSRNNDVMRMGRLQSSWRFLNSWAKFNVTSVPDDALICNVTLRYTVYDTYSGDNGCGTNVNIRHMANDPVSATNPALLTDIRDGDIYQTRDFGGPVNGPNGTRVTANFGNIQHVQNSLIPNWVALGFEYYQSGSHDECYVYIRGFSHTNKPVLIIEYTGNANVYNNVGYTASTNGTIPPNPSCTDWSNTWCAGSGTFSQVDNLVQGVNYTVENLGTGACGPAMPNAYMQAWAPGGTNCGRTPLGSVSQTSYSFDGTANGSYYFNVSSGLCGASNTCGEFTGHDFTGQSAVLRYRQNTTVTNTTPTTDICTDGTKNLSATLGGIHNNPTVQWVITQGSGTISGNTFTAGATSGPVTIQAVVGFCSSSITFNVIDGPLINNTDLSICDDGPINIGLSSTPQATTFSWTQISSNVSGASDGSGAAINQTLSLTSGSTGTVTYSISASDGGGCVATKDIVVTITDAVTPSFTPVGPFCSGDVITSLPTTSTNGVTGSWSPAINNTQTTTYTFTPDIGQCALTTTLSITVNPLVNPTFVSVGPYCSGDVIPALTTTSTEGITGTWSPALDNTQTTTYTFTPAVGQCASTVTQTITIGNQVVPTFTPVSPVCSGATIPALPTTSTEGITGTWSPAINNTQTTSYTFTPTSNQCALSTTMSITVNPLPNAIVTPSTATICSGSAIAVNLSSSNIGTQFAWTASSTGNAAGFTPNGTANAIADVLTSQSTGTVTYTVVPTLNGCVGSSVSATITINGIPVAQATPSSQTLCSGSVTGINLTSSLPGTQFNWTATSSNTTGAANGSGNQINQLLTTTSGVGTVNYTITPQFNGCLGTPIQVPITIEGAVIPSIVLNSSVGCAPIDLSISNTTPGNNSYLWNFGDGTTSTLASPSHSYAQVGCYDVSLTITTQNGCVSQLAYPSAVCVLPPPTAEFVPSTSLLNSENTTVTFTNESTNATSYSWDFGDNSDISNSFNATHTFPPSFGSSFTVTLTATNDAGCVDTYSMIFTIEEDLVYYVPNSFTPDGDELNNTFKPVFTAGFDPYNYNMKIYNRWGELIFESKDVDYGWDGAYMGAKGLCQEGTYIWVIEFKLLNKDVRKRINGHTTLIR